MRGKGGVPMAEHPQDLQVQLTPSVPPSSGIYANACLINRIGQSLFLDFALLDPLVLATRQANSPVTATHVGRIIMTEDAAVKLRDTLNQILGHG
jgi:hypothetical protein